MSDLANSCEYLTSEKLCLAVSNDEKAMASRQVRCKNSDKMTCCYLCMLVLDCATPCRFLGSAENDTRRIDPERNQITNTVTSEQESEADKAENETATLCSLCNVEMSQTKTNFRIDGWIKSNQKLADDDSRKPTDEILPVMVYLCPKCGKIEFRADRN